MKFVNERIAIGNSSDRLDEHALNLNKITALLVVADDLASVGYDLIIEKSAPLICGPGNTAESIQNAVSTAETLLKWHPKLLVCCHSGLDLSPLLSAAVVSKVENMTFEHAWKRTRERVTDVKFTSDLVEHALMESFRGWDKQNRYIAHHVSVVMPVYKRLDVTRRCVESLRRCSNEVSIEIIAIDDGSNDTELSDYLHDSCDIVVVHETNQGIASSRNDGMNVATGDIICQIDNDVVFFPDWLSPLVKTLITNDEVAIVSPLFNFNMPYFTDSIGILDKNNLIEVEEVGAACMLFFKALTDRIGIFDEKLYNLWEDKDFCKRLRNADFAKRQIAIDPRVTVYHHGHVNPETGEWDRSMSTRSFSELQDPSRIWQSMKLINERWGVKHVDYDQFDPETKAEIIDV